MRVHFYHMHVRYTAIILEEDNLPHPRCPQCNIIVPWRALNARNPITDQFSKGAEIKRQQMAEDEMRDSAGREFQA